MRRRVKTFLSIASVAFVLAFDVPGLPAQTPAPPPAPAYQPLTDQQLEQLLGPIALYPDPLIAEILPASTVPAQVVMADRYISGGGDPNLIDQQSWDPSVQAVARYPSVLKWMDDNLNWTADVGQAFLNQQSDVMNAIQRLRRSAYNLGNLQSTPQQQVMDEGGNLEIVPANPDVIYVPVYQPDPVYYETDYGPPFITFGVGCAVGAWLDCDFDWDHRHLIIWDHDHQRPHDWWHEPHHDRDISHARVWHPEHRMDVWHNGDRGWNSGESRHPAGVPDRSGFNFTARPETPEFRQPAAHSTPAPMEPARSFHPPESGGAFTGIQSSRDTRIYSNRGQQSLQGSPHFAPGPAVSRGPPGGGRAGGWGGGSGGRRR